MIENLSDLITSQRNKSFPFPRRRRKIDSITDSPSSSSIEEAKAKVEEIIRNGKKKREEDQ